ncbi:hypothetical protein ACFL3C_00790 [Patescibacteria group bacterium]
MESKKLYVISSLHQAEGQSWETIDKIENIREIRMLVIEAIARTIQTGGIFIDGSTAKDATEDNKIIDEESLDDIKSRNSIAFAMRYIDPKKFDIGKTYELFKCLRQDGLKFEFKHTEDCEMSEVMEFYRPLIEADPEFQEFIKTCKSQEEFSEFIFKKFLELRDKRIINNIITNGEDENILFIGSDHELADLEASQLDFYRVEVSMNVETVLITGKLPVKFESNLRKFVTEMTDEGGKVEIDIRYI